MKAKMFDDLSTDEIIDNLEAEAIEVEEKQYLKAFDDEELTDVKNTYTEAQKQAAILQDRINELTKPLKEEKDGHTKIAKELLNDIKLGGRMETGKVYLIPDYEKRVMLEYSEDGSVVGTRPFTHKERQLHINSFKTGTND